MTPQRGKVYLIGAGPGDPGLLTLRGKECLEEAAVVVYDSLVNPAVLDHAPERAERIYVGKHEGRHTIPQEEINALLIARAKEGNTVARVKGGDPFIFGRGGEEAEALAEAGIPFEVVPGVTSAVAAPAYAGIPLTHRELTSSVAFITGHEATPKRPDQVDWAKLATGAGTLVLYMGIRNLPVLAEALIRHGRDPRTPAAVIRWGTTPRQETVVGTLEEIAEKARNLSPPGIIVVGEVVALRDRLRWFEARPLLGKRVLVTRTREQAGDLTRRLERLGAEVVPCPTIALIPPESWEPLDAAIRRIETYDWVIFTSPNGVRFFRERLRALGRDLRALGRARVAAIGPQTAAALEEAGILADLVPARFQAEGVVEAMAGEPLAGRRILLPRAAVAREILPETLRGRGATVDVVPAYRTVPPRDIATDVCRLLAERCIDVVTFTSASTVGHFAALCGEAPYREWLRGVEVACIGPVTARQAEELGIKPTILPETFTIPALVEAIVGRFQEKAFTKRIKE